MGRESGTTPDEARAYTGHASYPNRWAVSPERASELRAAWREAARWFPCFTPEARAKYEAWKASCHATKEST